MSHARRQRFTYGLAGEFITRYGALAFEPADETIGGSRTSGAGIPVAYMARRDALMMVTLRVMEDEWEDCLAFLQFGQSAASFLWYPDADEATNFAVYLETPKMGERIKPARDGQFARMFQMPVTLRGVGAVVPWFEYFGA